MAPIQASSGKTTRHRLNRSGSRQANHALWHIVFVRRTCDPATKAYFERRRGEGKSDREITRCLKRHVAREVYRLLTSPQAVPQGEELRTTRTSAGISLQTAAEALGTWPIRLSRIERALAFNRDLADRYEHWLAEQQGD